MKLLWLPSAQHFSFLLHKPTVDYILTQFMDGEWHVQLNHDVNNQKITVVSSIGPHSDSIMQLLLVLNALQRNGAIISLIIPYCGYLRQDRALHGEPLSLQIVSQLLLLYSLATITLIHVHNEKLKEIVPFKAITPFDFFYQAINDAQADVIVAADEGAYPLAKKLAISLAKPCAFIKKTRNMHDHIQKVELVGDCVRNKRVIIVDDIISTGKTIQYGADQLARAGALTIHAAATHGIFSDEKLFTSKNIDTIFVTDTVCQKEPSHLVKIISIASLLEKILL